MKKLLFILVICLTAEVAQAQNDSVTISGKVTDFDGTPIDSCTVCWMNESFETITQALTILKAIIQQKSGKETTTRLPPSMSLPMPTMR